MIRTAAILVVAFALSACSRQSDPVGNTETPADSNILAQVGDEVLTTEEFEEAIARRKAAGGPEAKAALLEQMVTRLKKVARAKQLGLDTHPEVIRQYEDILVATLNAELSKDQPTQPTPSELEVQEYFNAHRDEFVVPARVRVAKIFVAAPPEMRAEKRAEKRQRIEQVREQALQQSGGARHFGRLAMEHSEDSVSKTRGGDIGYLTEEIAGGLPSEALVAAAFSLEEVGEVTPVVEGPGGFYILKLIEKTGQVQRPFASASSEIRSRLTRAQRTEAAERIELTSTAGVATRVNHGLLDQIAPAPATSPAGQTDPPGLPGS